LENAECGSTLGHRETEQKMIGTNERIAKLSRRDLSGGEGVSGAGGKPFEVDLHGTGLWCFVEVFVHSLH
jgi:hypothetical protein